MGCNAESSDAGRIIHSDRSTGRVNLLESAVSLHMRSIDDSWELVDGYANIVFVDADLTDLCREKLHFLLKCLIRRDELTVEAAREVHRASRMYIELMTEGKLSMLSAEDLDVLGRLQPDPKTGIILKVIDDARRVVKADGGSIVMADHVAKGIAEVCEG